MVAKRVLITGANRGLGLQFVKQILASKDAPEILFATCRQPDSAQELNAVSKSAKKTKVHILKLDVCDESSVQSTVEFVTQNVGSDGLNLLINNAGTMDKKIANLNTVTAQNLEYDFKTNIVAPTMLTKALLPSLRQAAKAQIGDPFSISRAAIIFVSTRMASIACNDSGGFYPYRVSKAGLNMVAKNMAIELKSDGILVLPIHPGWVRTDMGGPNAAVTPDDSVTGMLKVLSLAREKDTGVFYDFTGQVLPW